MKPAKSDISMKVWPASDRLAERAGVITNLLLRDASHQLYTVITMIIVSSVVLHVTTYSMASLKYASMTSMSASNHLRSFVLFIDDGPE
jgi:hypothetical protein